MTVLTPKNQFERLLTWYETLSPSTLTQLPEFYAVYARFKDPFNDVTGQKAIMTIFEHMFMHTQQPRFLIVNKLYQASQAFVTWNFEFGIRNKSYVIHGATHLLMNEQGLVTLHRDYWDATEELLVKLPVIGWQLRIIRKWLAVGQS